VLGNLQAVTDWTDREHPDDTTWRRVAEVVFLIAERPWAAPSYPEPFTTGQPKEIRAIAVDGTGVAVTYEHEHATGRVDLLLITSH
jgi:hypothetical protein